MLTAGSMRNSGPSPWKPLITFVVLAFVLSSVFWYLTITTPAVAANATSLYLSTVAVMWCPAAAAVITRLAYQRDLKGFGFAPGPARWLLASILIPVGVGLVMFGTAWISGVAPFNEEHAAIVLSLAFIPALLYSIAFNLFAAAGEEIGWRGFLVPELAKRMNFTGLALLSSAIWAVWHFPLILFGTYHGTGPVWYSLAVFVPSVMGAGVVLAWLRLASGSVWTAILFHGFWNYFIQQFYPALTITTPAGDAMLGEFGWFVTLAYVVLALVFWYFRDRLPGIPDQEPA
ncbi:MAG: CPBP family intramembrane metalloprotease [Methanoregulaceae archaeon]|nr:CPBP family intramembrane metalloprotease [Methanoregulaceae archaeon]